METNGADLTKQAAMTVLNETFTGPGDSDGMFLNTGTGLLETLEGISSEEASTEVSGATVAAHARHLRLYLDVMMDCISGKIRMPDWQAGWLEKTVSEKEWAELRDGIRSSVRNAEKVINKISVWNKDATTLVMSLSAHSAYHLGAIRQIIKHL